MARIVPPLDEPSVAQYLKLLLRALARDTHGVGDLWSRDGFTSEGDSPEHLPAGAGQTKRFDQPVAPFQQAAIDPEYRKRDVRQLGGCGIRMRCHGETPGVRAGVSRRRAAILTTSFQ